MVARVQGGSFLFGSPDSRDVFVPEDLQPNQRQVGDAASEYVSREVIPVVDRLERQDWDVSRQLLRKAGELGFTGIEIPTAFGGLGLDKITASVVARELGAAASFAVTFMVHAGIGSLPIVYFGTPAQKQKYLPSLASAERVAAYSLTETGSGSDALGARASARLSSDGHEYILNGTKQWTSNAGFADLFVLFAKVDGKHFTAFLVDRATSGVTIGPEEHKMGLWGSSTAQVVLSNARVPVENVLHFVGKGHQVAFNMLNLGRFKLGAVCLGGCRHLLGVSTRYAQARHQFGHPIASFPLIQQKLAAMAVRTYVVEAMTYRIAGLLDGALGSLDLDGDAREASASALAEYAIECSIAKVYASEALSEVVDEGVQIHGGYGFMQGYDVERTYRDSRINRIFEGTNEINRLLIPQTLFRRTQRGELPAFDATQVQSQLTISGVIAPNGGLERERWAIDLSRALFWHVAGVARRRYLEHLEDEQEVLADLADIAIQTFAMESTLLRATRAVATGDDNAALHRELAGSAVAGAIPRIVTASRRALGHLIEASDETAARNLVAELDAVAAFDTIALGRRIAASVLDHEGWPLK